MSYELNQSYEGKGSFESKEITVLNKYMFWNQTVQDLSKEKVDNADNNLEKVILHSCDWCNSGCGSCSGCGGGGEGCCGCNSCGGCE